MSLAEMWLNQPVPSACSAIANKRPHKSLSHLRSSQLLSVAGHDCQSGRRAPRHPRTQQLASSRASHTVQTELIMRSLLSLPLTAIAVGFAVVPGNYAEAGNAT